jgi:hypothetical protein
VTFSSPPREPASRFTICSEVIIIISSGTRNSNQPLRRRRWRKHPLFSNYSGTHTIPSMVTNMMFNMDMDQQAMRSFMNSKFAQNNDVNINRMGANDLLINDQYVDWTSRRQHGSASRGIVEQQYSRQNEWAEEYYELSSGASSDTSVTQQPSSKPAPSLLPPRPQRPFTEYNVSDICLLIY